MIDKLLRLARFARPGTVRVVFNGADHQAKRRTVAATVGLAAVSSLIALSCDEDRVDAIASRFKLTTLNAAVKLKEDEETVIKPSSSENKKHYNFIADVVEHTAPAVVYIEVTN